jgi:hypothetical protein
MHEGNSAKINCTIMEKLHVYLEEEEENRKKEIEAKWIDKTAQENCRNPVALLRLISGCKSVNHDDIRQWMNQDNSNQCNRSWESCCLQPCKR